MDKEYELFLAGWTMAFRYCNPDVGFKYYPDNPEQAYKQYLKERHLKEKDK